MSSHEVQADDNEHFVLDLYEIYSTLISLNYEKISSAVFRIDISQQDFDGYARLFDDGEQLIDPGYEEFKASCSLYEYDGYEGKIINIDAEFFVNDNDSYVGFSADVDRSSSPTKIILRNMRTL